MELIYFIYHSHYHNLFLELTPAKRIWPAATSSYSPADRFIKQIHQVHSPHMPLSFSIYPFVNDEAFSIPSC